MSRVIFNNRGMSRTMEETERKGRAQYALNQYWNNLINVVQDGTDEEVKQAVLPVLEDTPLNTPEQVAQFRSDILLEQQQRLAEEQEQARERARQARMREFDEPRDRFGFG